MKLKATLFAAAATLAMAPAAHAYEGLYGAIGAGLAYMGPDRDVEEMGGPVDFDSEADYDNGIGVYGALGYAYASGFRTELEVSYRANDVRHFAGDGMGFSGWPTQLDGEAKSLAVMVNALYDFDTGSFITPYVGAGIGGARISAEYFGNNPGAIGGFSTVAIDDDVTRLAFQGIAGLAIELAENLSLDLSYRYFDTIDPDFDGTYAGVPADFKIDYASHSLFAGLRWNFGAAPAAAPEVQYKDCWDGSSVPVSAECPAQIQEVQSAVPDPVNFIVYFDYDKSNLTPEAANLVREASSRALANEIDTVVVAGNADRSGSSAYNQALSQRRANVVRDALIANGVPAEMIDTRAFGEDNPAKPTPDGVREPLNRRTEVVISFE